MKIYEFNQKGRPMADITINIPFSFEVGGERSNEEYKRMALENLRNQSGVLFNLTAFLGRINDDFEDLPSSIGEVLQFLGEIGLGLQEAAELTESWYRRESEETEAILNLLDEDERKEVKEASQRFGHSRKLAAENKVYQLCAGLINHRELSIKQQNQIFSFLVESSILSADNLKEISIVTGVTYNPDEPAETSKVLDLSEQPENLNLNSTEGDCSELAKHISAILNNPLTPKKIYDGLSDGICELGVSKEVTDSPQYLSLLLCNQPPPE